MVQPCTRVTEWWIQKDPTTPGLLQSVHFRREVACGWNTLPWISTGIEVDTAQDLHRQIQHPLRCVPLVAAAAAGSDDVV